MILLCHIGFSNLLNLTLNLLYSTYTVTVLIPNDYNRISEFCSTKIEPVKHMVICLHENEHQVF